MTSAAPAHGYRRMVLGQCVVIARDEHAGDAEAMLRDASTLYESAARTPGARALAGRGTAYAIELPVTRVSAVVRHNRHGGLLAPLTGDRFAAPTRAPYELVASRQLAAAGVRTPDVLMLAVSPVNSPLQRADVVTKEVRESRDLAAYMQPDQPAAARSDAWAATRSLIHALESVGARHEDLNVKNVLLARGPDALEAWVLDVDRVVFGTPNAPEVTRKNVARLRRSARKWRDQHGAVFEESELPDLD